MSEEDKKSRGLTMPGNPALELQRMMLEEGRQPVAVKPIDSNPSPNQLTNSSDNNITNQLTDLPINSETKPVQKRAARKQGNSRRDEPINEPSAQPTNQLTNSSDNQLSNQPNHKETGPNGQKQLAYRKSQQLAATEMKVIGLKIPDGLNDFLDEYYMTHRKAGIKKQDLVKLALQWLVVHLETGERIEELEG